jgi:hypothetical protein
MAKITVGVLLGSPLNDALGELVKASREKKLSGSASLRIVKLMKFTEEKRALYQETIKPLDEEGKAYQSQIEALSTQEEKEEFLKSPAILAFNEKYNEFMSDLTKTEEEVPESIFLLESDLSQVNLSVDSVYALEPLMR